jgi:hypothetical protein
MPSLVTHPSYTHTRASRGADGIERMTCPNDLLTLPAALSILDDGRAAYGWPHATRQWMDVIATGDIALRLLALPGTAGSPCRSLPTIRPPMT